MSVRLTEAYKSFRRQWDTRLSTEKSATEIRKELDILNDKDVHSQPWAQHTGKHGIKRKGQQKLYYADLLAFLLYVQKNGSLPKYCVVAGGGGGWKGGFHFVKLVRQIQALPGSLGSTEWHLYDPGGFYEDLKNMKGVNIYKNKEGFFSETTALQWQSETGVLFLSDIRNVDKRCKIKGSQESLIHFEKLIQKDMQDQKTWVEIMQPKMAVLKFRAPYAIDRTKNHVFEYLDGKLYFEPYDSYNSTEMRLVVTDPRKVKSYDFLKIESTCAWFNNHARDHGKWDEQHAKEIQKAYEELKSTTPSSMHAF